MAEPAHVQHIWSRETGITDVPEDFTSLSSTEIPGIQAVWREQRERLKGSKLLQDFTDKLNREWAIETGIIEGLYDIERGVTETLIEQGFRADFLRHGSTNRKPELVITLLESQKDALDGVFDFVNSTRPLSTSFIKELHATFVQHQHETDAIDTTGLHVSVPLIKGDWKTWPNYPVRDGVRYEYCPPEQVASEMDRLIALHQEHSARNVPPEVEAAWLHHRFTQIHPFQDGNGRVARALASLVLIKAGLFPLLVTRDDVTYLEALEKADKGDLRPLIELIVRLQRTQFRKATALSESMLSQHETVDNVLKGLLKSAERTAQQRRTDFDRVFDHAPRLLDNLRYRFVDLRPDLLSVLQHHKVGAEVIVTASHEDTSHYYKWQIIQNAKQNLHYFANLQEYRSWILLRMTWGRQAKLVFAIHGVGRPFSGTLICAPFLEFIDKGEDDHHETSLVPVAREGFLFFHTETAEEVLRRFEPWREEVLLVALRELGDNL